MATPRPVSAAEWVAVGQAAARRLPPDRARLLLSRLGHPTPIGADDAVTRAAVELAVRGFIEPASLPPNGRVELAVIELTRAPDAAGVASAATPVATPIEAAELDPRHLALAQAAGLSVAPPLPPGGDLTDGDAVARAARWLSDMTRGQRTAPASVRASRGFDASDPLLSSVLQRAERAAPEVSPPPEGTVRTR
jgi:hypothetical protein